MRYFQIKCAVAFMVAFWVSVASADAVTESTGEDMAGEDVEAVEVIETVETVTPLEVIQGSVGGEASQSEVLSSTVVMGRLHPAFVHLPLGLLVALLLMVWTRVGKDALRLEWLLWAVTLASFFPAMISGLLRAKELIDNGGQMPFESHRNWMLLSCGVLVMALILKIVANKRNKKILSIISIIVLVGAICCAFLGAHLGGKLVYGMDFLPF